MNNKVRLLGLDGMSLDMFRDLIEEGLLPNGAFLMQECQVVSDLESTVPFFTVPAWASLFSGTNPGRHGLLWWKKTDPAVPWNNSNADGWANLNDGRQPYVWDLATAAGKRLSLIDIPGLFPAPQVGGVAVSSGFLCPWPSPAGVWPQDRYESVRGWMPPEKSSEDDVDGDDSLAREIEFMARSTRQRLDLFRSTCRSDDDLVAAVIVGPDRLSHLRWDAVVPASDATGPVAAAGREFWAVVDEFLGEIVLSHRGGATVVVCSDHGSAAAPAVEFHTRTWLRERGMAAASGAARILPAALLRALRPLRSILRRIATGYRPSRPGVSFGVDAGASHVVDISMGDREVGFFVSTALSDEQRSALTRELIGSLGDVERGGRPVFDRIERGASILGVIAEGVMAPDVVAVSRPDVRLTPGSALDALWSKNTKPHRGIHRPEGLLLMGGRAAPPRPMPRVVDIAPTLLAAIGLSPGEWMDGASLCDADDDLLVPVEWTGTGSAAELSADDEEMIERHLRSLGYVE